MARAASFVDKGKMSTVQFKLNGLPDEAALAERKARWESRLAALAKHVG